MEHLISKGHSYVIGLRSWKVGHAISTTQHDSPFCTRKIGAAYVNMKKSIFERQKEEAEAKKAREQAENAAALADFVKSFEDDGSTTPSTHARAIPSAPGRRHFTTSGLKSGPGSLGPSPAPRSGPGSLGPTFNKKRHFDDYNDRKDRNSGFSYQGEKRVPPDEDGESDEKAAIRPTIQLSSLPPGTSPAVIKGLFVQSKLVIENVRILPTSGGGNAALERKSTSAIVTLAAETPGADIDAVVSQLQNKYVGYGFNLSISRHLSSAAVANVALSAANNNELPFGAKPLQQQASLSRAPPPGHRFAPPSSYTSTTAYSRSAAQVTVQAPADLNQLRLIHMTLEALLTHGPEFEALLMSRPEVQRDEKWSWLWNSRSLGGVYYRWRLWEILTDAKSRRKHGRHGPQSLFDGQSTWLPPEDPLRFEFTTQIDEFVSDEDYNSSDEEENDAGIASRYTDHNSSAAATEEGNDGVGYLNPLAKSKLVHLLSRLPDTSAKLRKGDVARITAFAIEHAGAGATEIVALVTRNVLKPLSSDVAAESDQTSASQVGLYVISDILSSSASAGVRHAWRYRTLFEQAMRQQKVWEQLGRAERDHQWGKLKADKWKRSIQTLLDMWEGWSVFPHATHEEFINNFTKPPLTEKEQLLADAEEKRQAENEAMRSKSVNKWRSVDDDPSPADVEMRDVDGAAMNEDSDMDDVPGEDIDGVPMDDSSDEEMKPDASLNVSKQEPDIAQPAKAAMTETSSTGRRQRPRAADMFADDSE